MVISENYTSNTIVRCDEIVRLAKLGASRSRLYSVNVFARTIEILGLGSSAVVAEQISICSCFHKGNRAQERDDRRVWDVTSRKVCQNVMLFCWLEKLRIKFL